MWVIALLSAVGVPRVLVFFASQSSVSEKDAESPSEFEVKSWSASDSDSEAEAEDSSSDSSSIWFVCWLSFCSRSDSTPDFRSNSSSDAEVAPAVSTISHVAGDRNGLSRIENLARDLSR